jgi:hypothetical protein
MAIVLKVHQARDIIRANLPGNQLKSIKPLASSGEGAFVLNLRNHPFKVVVKVLDSRRWEMLIVEREVENLLKGIEGVQVPEYIAMDDSGKVTPFSYSLRSFLPGLPWSDVMPLLPFPDRLSLAEQCGRILGGYHSVSAEVYGEIHGDERSTSWSELILHGTMANCEKVREMGWFASDMEDKIRDYLLDIDELLDRERRPCLTHRRLNPGDFLVKNEGGDWIAVGLLRTGGSGYWHHLWDLASLRRLLGDGREEILDSLESSHYEVITRPENYGEILRVHEVMEMLHHLSRTHVEAEEAKNMLVRMETLIAGG